MPGPVRPPRSAPGRRGCCHRDWLPERLLLVTFTRRAARELLGRARSQAPFGAAAATIVGGTFHSLAHRFVRLHAGALGLGGGFSVLDAGDAADLLDLLRSEHGCAAGRRRFPRASTMLDIYSRVVNAQRPLRETLTESFPWCEEHAGELAEVFGAYAARKREQGLLDLDDLLLGWRALMGEERTGRAVAGSFEHVLVDEYQDVNALQVDIVAGLRRWGGGLSVVGDDFQAIYGFRAASARHILGFPQVFGDAHTVLLERNYRSTQEILEVANGVSAQDPAPSRGVCGVTARGACARSSCSRTTTVSRRGRCATGCWRPVRRRSSCARRRSCSAPATTPPCWSWS